MKQIYYLGFYDTAENEAENRQYFLAATNKMDYIVSALESKGHRVQLVSASGTKNHSYYKGKTVPVGQRSRLRLFDTWGSKYVALRVLGRLFTAMQFNWYILTHVKKGDTVIAYHSLKLIRRLRMLQKVCRFRLVLEIEEIYGDVGQEQAVSQRELKFFQKADAYLFPAVELNEKINRTNKPYALIHGTYQVEQDRGSGFSDGKVHCVYAGNLDPRKGGAVMAAEAARYLPESYHLHILGFGSEEEIGNMKNLVQQLQTDSRCTVTYDGCLQGEEYIRFLQSCQVGLSTQNPNAAFNDTSFPSKILSYMANGLQVVTVRIPVVEHSAIGEDMYYYDTPTAQAIAQAILRTQTEGRHCDGRARLQQLDKEFCNALVQVLEEV